MKIYVRLGVELDLPQEQGLKILEGDGETLLAVLNEVSAKNGEWIICDDIFVMGNDVNFEWRES